MSLPVMVVAAGWDLTEKFGDCKRLTGKEEICFDCKYFS